VSRNQGSVVVDTAVGAGSGSIRRRGGTLRRSALAIGAVGGGLAYLGWRVGWSMGDTWWISVPFLVAEAILFVRFVLGVPATLPDPESDHVLPTVDADDGCPTMELLVPAGHADVDALAPTLVPAGRLVAGTRIRVLDHRSRVGMRREAERLGASYEVHDVDPVDGPSALIEAARPDLRSETFAWVDAGDVIVPGFAAMAARLVDPSRPHVAVVQTSTDLVNSDSLRHLVPDRDELALQNHVTGPSLSRSGCAPWTGSGSICRVDAIEEIGGLPVGADAARRGAMRLDRAGWSTLWMNPPMVRSVAPDTLSDLLGDAGSTAHADWAALGSADSALAPVRTRWRRRCEHLRASTAVLDGLARLLLFGVLAATLLTGRLPVDAPLATFAVLFSLQMAARVATTVSLARGTIRLGDTTRQGLRLMGVHVVGLVRAPRGPRSVARGGREVLGELRLLCAALVLVDLALAARGLALFVDGVLPPFDRSGQFLAMAAAVWSIIITVDVLQLLVGRVQRRSVHRSITELVATVGDVRCRVVDLTPEGIGLLLPNPDRVPDEQVRIRLDIPRLDGTTTGISVSGHLRHMSDTIDPSSGWFRAGARFGHLGADARDALVEFCALTVEQRDLGREVAPSAAPGDLVVLGGSRPRRALAGASVAAIALAGILVASGPVAAAEGPLTGSITGRVLDTSGAPSGGACVSTGSGPTASSTTTSADGTFTLTTLSDGSYSVVAADCGGGGESVPTYSGSVVFAQQALVVPVSGGGSATVGDIRQHPSGSFRGRALQGAVPVADVCVSLAVDVGGSPQWWFLGRTAPDGSWQGTAPAGVTGAVNLSDCLDPARFVPTWYAGVVAMRDASALSVGAGATRDLGDVTLLPGVWIEGHVSDPTGVPLGGVCVSAQDTSGGARTWIGGSTTDPLGDYGIFVTPGTYSIWFSDCGSGADVISKWYPDAPAYSEVIPTVVVPPAGARFDTVMQRGGRASGTLVDDTGALVPGDACVGLRPTDDPSVGTVSWDRVRNDGTWTSSPVAPGDYLVEYRGCDDNWNDDGTYVAELRSDIFLDGPDDWSLEDASPVHVVAEALTTGVDDDLLRAVRLSGRVSTAGGALGVRDICVGGVLATSDRLRTADDGTWSAAILPGRPTTVTFTDCTAGRGFVQQSRVVQGSPGEVVRLDVDLEPGTPSSVTGTVRNSAGHAPADTCVAAYVPSNVVSFAAVAPDGSFELAGLADGDYWFGAFGCGDDDVSGMVDPDDPTIEHPAVWYPDSPIQVSEERSPAPSEQGVPVTQVRSSTPVARLDFCLGTGCGAVVTTTAPPATTVPVATSVPTDPGSSVPARPAPAQPAPGPTGPVGSRRGPVFGRSPSAGRRGSPMAPGVEGEAPTVRMEKLAAARRSGPSVEVSTEPDEPTSTVQPGTVPGYAPSMPQDAGGSLPGTGQPVSRDTAQTIVPASPGVAWDLLGGIALVAAAAIGLLMLWRRRHPGF